MHSERADFSRIEDLAVLFDRMMTVFFEHESMIENLQDSTDHTLQAHELTGWPNRAVAVIF